MHEFAGELGDRRHDAVIDGVGVADDVALRRLAENLGEHGGGDLRDRPADRAAPSPVPRMEAGRHPRQSPGWPGDGCRSGASGGS